MQRLIDRVGDESCAQSQQHPAAVERIGDFQHRLARAGGCSRIVLKRGSDQEAPEHDDDDAAGGDAEAADVDQSGAQVRRQRGHVERTANA